MVKSSRWMAVWLALAIVGALAAAAAAVPAAVSGLITAVDLDGRTLTIKDPNGTEITLVVPKDAVIVLDGDEQATLDDLFEGDELKSGTVKPGEGGKLYLVKGIVASEPEDAGEDDTRLE